MLLPLNGPLSGRSRGTSALRGIPEHNSEHRRSDFRFRTQTPVEHHPEHRKRVPNTATEHRSEHRLLPNTAPPGRWPPRDRRTPCPNTALSKNTAEHRTPNTAEHRTPNTPNTGVQNPLRTHDWGDRHPPDLSRRRTRVLSWAAFSRVLRSRNRVLAAFCVLAAF